MYVITAVLEQSPPPSRTVRDPTWEQIRGMVEQLDGRTCTSLILEHSEEDYLTIGGGDGQYVCEIYKETAPNDFQFWDLLNPASGLTEPIKMIVGAEIYVEPQYCVGREAVLQAAKTFFERGLADELLPWETR